jgi:hypothetical protein
MSHVGEEPGLEQAIAFRREQTRVDQRLGLAQPDVRAAALEGSR